MLNIEIKTVKDSEQRYNTIGDWYKEDGKLTVNVSQLSDWRYEFLIGVHELIEAMLCKQDRVTEADVDAFDQKYNENRSKGDVSEPGDNPEAPYHSQHAFATKIEMEIAKRLGVDWDAYSKEADALNID